MQKVFLEVAAANHALPIGTHRQRQDQPGLGSEGMHNLACLQVQHLNGVV